jgi:ABC-type branched-subunit amino acid transport system substrate-binding protein
MKKVTIGLVVVIIILGFAYYSKNNKTTDISTIKLGILTDLTGPAAYWGESTKVGVDLAVKELRDENINVLPIFEDYQLNATKAAAATQKLVNVDKVEGLYAEFNPGAITAGSVVKDKNVLYLYDAAIESPLQNSPTTYKTYLDFRKGCTDLALQFKDQGISKVGVLKMTLEHGELCATGIKSVFGENAIIEEYNLGDTDFRTALLKLKSQNVGAIINVAFEGDAMNTLSAMKKSGIKLPFGTVTDTITDKVKSAYEEELKGSISFGFKDVDQNLVKKLVAHNSGKELGSNYAAALGYLHIKQMAHALSVCKENVTCAGEKISTSPKDDGIGFQKFVNRIAQLDLEIKKH